MIAVSSVERDVLGNRWWNYSRRGVWVSIRLYRGRWYVESVNLSTGLDYARTSDHATRERAHRAASRLLSVAAG